jgi:hypothetical protein
MSFSMRKFFSRRVLRGAAGQLWADVKTPRVAKQHQRLLLSRMLRPLQERPSNVSRSALRRLLFVCDNMWEQRELLPELQKICEVTFRDVGPFKQSAQRACDERLDTDRLLASLNSSRSESFDLIIVYLNSALLSDELLNWVRAAWKCPLVGMNFDDKTTYEAAEIFKSWAGNYRSWAGRFDCNLSNSASMTDVYRSEGFPCIYVPTGFHYEPGLHRFKSRASFDYPLSFVGSFKPERGAFIHELERLGVKVNVFGGGWPGAQFTNRGWEIYRASQINLGIGYNLPGHHFTNLKNRDFECPGAGGCYLTTYDWELGNLLEVGKEILCYRELTDFVEQYAWYSRRPDVCQRIAEAGHRRCINEHTWEKRFRRVFAELGFEGG